MRYEDYPALFCFGLLREFDVDTLAALCTPAEVDIAYAEPSKD
jgi:hypothetical protein